MTHPALLATGAALLIALADPAGAQSAADLLPPDPGIRTDPEREVAPPEEPEAAAAVTQGGGAGPSFVLGGIALDGATAIPEAELAPIWAELIGQPVTLAALEEIALQIGIAYRARGFVLSQAILPAQSIEDGIVRIQVIEGFVDRVEISGGTDTQRGLADRTFAPVAEERPLKLRTLERAVLLSRDTFGGTAESVETVIEPSPDTFAAADLGVALEPDPWNAFAAIDNRGSRLYGQWTLAAGGSAYGQLGLNERLDGLLAVSPTDGSLAFASGVFDMPLPGLDGTALDGGRFEFAGDISRSDPDLTKSGSPEDLRLILNEWNLRAGMIVPFVRARSQNLFGRLSLGWRDSQSENLLEAVFEETSTDRLAVLETRLTWDVADRFGGVSLVDATWRQGLDIGAASIGAQGPAAGTPDFTRLNLVLSRLQRLGNGPWALYGEAIGQYGANVLPNSERFSLGSATIGRGFAPGNTTGDSGYGGRLELRRGVPGAVFGAEQAAVEFYGFGDYGQTYDRVVVRDGLQWETLSSVGIGARIDVADWLTIIPEITRQTAGVATDTTDPDLETRGFISAVARF